MWSIEVPYAVALHADQEIDNVIIAVILVLLFTS